jgi:DNA-binding transcriptional regulator YiaG
MSRPQESLSKVADVFGVTRQAVHKWRQRGAPFHSAEALLGWLANQHGIRALDNFHPRCPALLARVKVILEPPAVYSPDRELAETFGVTLETIAAWRHRGAPVEDMGELAEWAMKEPGIFEGYERAQAVADRLPGMARRASAAGDTAFASLLLDTLAGWTSSLHCRAFWRAR